MKIIHRLYIYIYIYVICIYLLTTIKLATIMISHPSGMVLQKNDTRLCSSHAFEPPAILLVLCMLLSAREFAGNSNKVPLSILRFRGLAFCMSVIGHQHSTVNSIQAISVSIALGMHNGAFLEVVYIAIKCKQQ